MNTWDQESVGRVLREKNWYKSEREIENGIQFLLSDGTKINCFRTGKVLVQGKKSPIKEEANTLFQSEATLTQASVGSDGGVSALPGAGVSPRRVFIVYGHDVDAREQLELLLRRLRLEPIVLQNLPAAGDTIIEKLEELTGADFACVLVTPDDEGRKHEKGGDGPAPLRPRARQNVVLELGMVLARLGRQRVAILLKGKDIEKPSDIDGLLYLTFESHVGEIKNDLGANLQAAGFNIQVKDLLPR